MKPLIKWTGGKSKEIEIFKEYYPNEFKVFIEPFVGGGAVFFNLNWNNNIINDIHQDLINFYEQIKNGKAQEIYNLMANFKNTEKNYYYIRDTFIPNDNVEKAFVFFYLRKTCFRGMLRYNKKGKFNIPYGRYKTYSFKELLNKNYETLLRKTKILNKDFVSLLEEYNDENNFVFLDPPYDSEFIDYGYCKFGKEEHKKLAEIFKDTKNKMLLIIGETDFISSLYRDYIIGEYNKKYAFKIHSGRVGEEINNKHLIIRNYSPR
jgi:DNA adenine methylase